MTTPANPDYESLVRSSFERQGLMTHLGARLERVEPGEVDIAVDYRPEVSQQHAFFHAGVTGAIADSAGGYAALTLMPGASSVLSVEYKLNLLAPAAGRCLVASARVVRSGRTLTVCSADVHVLRDEERVLCATMLQTLIALPTSDARTPG